MASEDFKTWFGGEGVLRYNVEMTALDLPPEIEAGVRELIRDGLKAAQKRAFDRELHEARSFL